MCSCLINYATLFDGIGEVPWVDGPPFVEWSSDDIFGAKGCGTESDLQVSNAPEAFGEELDVGDSDPVDGVRQSVWWAARASIARAWLEDSIQELPAPLPSVVDLEGAPLQRWLWEVRAGWRRRQSRRRLEL